MPVKSVAKGVGSLGPPMAFNLWVSVVVILALLLLISMKPPYPPRELPGMEVNLGNSLTGSGDVQPEEVQQQTQTASTPSNTEPEHVVTQSDPSVKVNQNTTQQQQQVEEKPVEPEIDKRFLFDQDKINQKGSSQGVNDGPGDQGQVNGRPGVDNYVGGKGDGV